MQKEYAYTGQLNAWCAFPVNIQIISKWDEMFLFLCHIFYFNFTVATVR